MPRDGSGVMTKAAGTTAVAGTVIESAKYNSAIDDIIADLNLARPITAGGTGATTAAGAQTNLGLLPGTFGFLYGLTLSNNAGDATNDIDIAAGTAASDAAAPTLITLASSITKRLDAAWAVGTNQGGLDTGSIANTTYHVWLIQRSDTSVVDVLFSTSATSPTMPANYDRKRRIGSIRRSASTILAFTQNGDEFLWKAGIADATSQSVGTTSALVALSVPTGVKANALFNASIVSDTAGTRLLITSPDQNTAVANTPSGNFQLYVSAANQAGSCFINMRTDTSGQVRVVSNATSATCGLSIVTHGYIDTRGRI